MYAAAHLAGDLISRMLPAYGAIAAGFCVGRLSGRDWIRHLSSLLMYVLIPLVVFKNALALNVGAAIGNVALSMAFSTVMVLCAALIVPRCKTDVPRRLAFCAHGRGAISDAKFAASYSQFLERIRAAGIPINPHSRACDSIDEVVEAITAFDADGDDAGRKVAHRGVQQRLQQRSGSRSQDDHTGRRAGRDARPPGHGTLAGS